MKSQRADAYVGRHASHRGYDAPVEGPPAAFGLVHADHGLPHAGRLDPALLGLQGRYGGGLDGESRPDNVEGICKRHGRDARQAAADEPPNGGLAQILTRLFEELDPGSSVSLPTPPHGPRMLARPTFL